MMDTPVGSYAVIFASKQASLDEAGQAAYLQTAERMFELAADIPGYLGVHTAHQRDGVGITVSYWENEAAIQTWREEVEHTEARRRGKAEWYQAYSLKVARIERAYNWNSDKASSETKEH